MELSFRQVNKNDYDIVFALWKNEAVRKYLGGISEDERIVKVFNNMVKNEDKKCKYFVIEGNRNTKIGIVSIDDYYIDGEKELSYQFLPEYWGRGYATRIIREIIEYVKNETRIDKIYAETQNKNNKSKTLLENIGIIEVEKKKDTVRCNQYIKSIYEEMANNRFNFTKGFVTHSAVASLGGMRANSPLKVKRMFGGRAFARKYNY